jgi:CRP/FNR family transcriptional regulator
MKRSVPSCDLQSCFLCTRCSPAWLPAISAHRENRKFKKGAHIFSEGDPVEGIFFIYSGKVKVHKKWGDEKELIVRFARSGDMVGYRGLGNELVYPVSATALDEVIVCFVDIPFFESTLQVNPTLTYALMKFYANELQEAERRMRNLAHMEVKGRVAETLLMLKKTFGANKQGFIDITLTKQDMASYSGTTYETFSRMANELINEKLIKVSGKNMAILKEKKLEELTQFTG